MKFLICMLILVSCKTSFSQDWHNAGEKLKMPKAIGNMYAAIGTYDRYDSVSIVYTTAGSTVLNKGYKFVYVRQGYFTDKSSTVNIFFDANWKRIYNVERYYFD